MTRKVSLGRQWLTAGAIFFLAAACQPQTSASKNQQSQPPRSAKPVEATNHNNSCKPAPQECVKDCPKKDCCPKECKKECPCPKECPKKECPCPKECPKKECPCPKECPKKECPCPKECPKQCEAEVQKEMQAPVVQSEVRSELKAEPTLSSSSAVETPAS